MTDWTELQALLRKYKSAERAVDKLTGKPMLRCAVNRCRACGRCWATMTRAA